jgi:hypothetical protein
VHPRENKWPPITIDPKTPLDTAIGSLNSKANYLNIIGFALFVLTAIAGVKLFIELKEATADQLKHFLDPAVATYPLLIFVLVKSAALTAVASAMLFFGVKLATACFDQAARFTKRRYGALFLKFLYSKFDPRDLNTPEGIEAIIKFFQAWNHNVESAFSNVKFEKGKKGVTELHVGKDGATVKTDDRNP